jgi:NitT/TauT family transport system substrate-binding protein
MDPGPAISALSAGKLDGVFLPHPAPSIIEVKGKGKQIVASGEMWPNHACCSLVVTSKLIKERPELVEQIIKTHIKATDYINSHPDEAAKIYAKKAKQNLTEIEHSIKTWDGKWISDPNVQIPSTVEYAKIDYKMNYTKRELSQEDMFDTSFFEKVTKAEANK